MCQWLSHAASEGDRLAWLYRASGGHAADETQTSNIEMKKQCSTSITLALLKGNDPQPYKTQLMQL